MQSEETRKFVEQLYNREETVSRYAIMRFFPKEGGADPGGLNQLLLIGDDQLNDQGKKIFDYLEGGHFDDEIPSAYKEFKWRLLAFISLQDALGLPFYEGITDGNMFRTCYFYHESQYLLTEAIVASINGIHVASKQIMRNFLEFSLLQLYLVNVANEEGSHKPLNDYFLRGILPGSNKLLEKALPNDGFCKPIKKRIQLELRNLSSRFSHAYHPEESPQSRGIFRPIATIESLYFWVHLSSVLEIVLWLYYVNLPMLFFPVDILKKFGFNPPMNLFVDKNTNFIIKQSVCENDYRTFSEYAAESVTVRDLMSFYDSRRDLTVDEIWKTWDDPIESGDTLETCYAKMLIKMRALSAGLSTYSTKDKEKGILEEEVRMHDFTKGFKHWQKVYKKY